MRAITLLLATGLPLITAVPSPNLDQQQQLGARAIDSHTPAWRSLSNRIIQNTWPSRQWQAGNAKHGREPPVHTPRSRRGEDLLLRFNITTADEAHSLAAVANSMYLDVWEFTQDWADIRVATDVLPHVLKALPSSLQHAHTPLLQERELVQAIYDTYPSPRTAVQAAQRHNDPAFGPALHSSPVLPAETNVFFTDYQPLSVIQPWMKLLASLFTTHVRLVNIGSSYEGREIVGLRVGVHPTNDEEPEAAPRKTVLVTGGLHAREWISTSTVNYLAYTLITGYGKSPAITQLLTDFDWVFIPTVNPDGYAYTWDTDRLWRKNRQKTSLRFCHGLDLDRSFGYEWAGESTRGNPCSESFAGDAPFAAVESERLAAWARAETDSGNTDFVGLLDLHSYSQQILYPYSYSCAAAPPSLENLQELAAGLAKAIRLMHGHAYQVAPACEGNVAALDAADGVDAAHRSSGRSSAGATQDKVVFPRLESGGGSALDWFYHELKVRYTYQVKLRDRGNYGFLLPKQHIVPTGQEMFDALMYFGKYLSLQFEAEARAGPGEDGANGQSKVSEPLGQATDGEIADEASGDEQSQQLKSSADEAEVYWELKRRRRT